ncbi:hypothetical protein [Haloarcula laminariae]|uniref:hypothetical protein n=1 Tax=Haloarcula laminariae TaxID=2961577 RepID=UPI0021C860AD|nr:MULTISPECIES: hypothetical protein [Halomicroarcula]
MTDVRIHLHFTMAAAVPLRLLDVVFRPDHLLFVEYDYPTPLDLATGAPAREADAFAALLRTEGLTAALDAADAVTGLPYDDVDAVQVYDGGRFGREAVVVDPVGDSTRVVRVHGDIDLDGFTAALRDVVDGYDVTVSRRTGLALGGWLRRLAPR